LIGLIVFGPILFTLHESFYRDTWTRTKVYEISYPNEIGYLSVNLEADRDENYNDLEGAPESDRYDITVKLQTSSDNEDVDLGMNNISIEVYLDDELSASSNEIFQSPRESFTDVFYVMCLGETVIKITGLVNLTLNTTSSLQYENTIYNNQVKVMGNSEIYYNFHLPLYWAYFGYFGGIIGITLGIVILSRRIGSIPGYSNEMKKRDSAYHEYLKIRREREDY
jgi:hypothetical protein